MAIFYIENENGHFFSSDGMRRFMRLSGKAAYDYLSTEEGKQKYFMKTSAYEDGGELEWIEVPEALVSQHLKDKRREQYVSDCIEDSGFVTISFYAAADDEDTDVASGEELIEDPTCNVEMQALQNIDIAALRSALKKLTPEEMWLVERLFLSSYPTNENRLSKELGITQSTLNYRKRKVLNKLKNFF